MAVAVASSANTTETSTSSLTITKPSGLVEDDFMLAVIFERSGGTPGTPSGWTLLENAYCEPNSNLESAIVIKKASAADEAASNFSFPSSGGTELMRGVLLRLTGVSEDLGFNSSYQRIANDDTPTFTVSTTPNTAGSLIVTVLTCNNSGTVSSATVSPSSPTFTEYFDTSTATAVVNAGTRTETTTITSLSHTMSGFSALNDGVGYVMSLDAATDASGSNDFLTTTATIFTQNGQFDVSGGNTLLTTTTTINPQTGTGGVPTSFSTTVKPSTTWTNTNKT